MNPYVNDNSGASTYKSVEVTSTNRIKLIVMVYDAAIASLKQAIELDERNETAKRNQYISRAQVIVHELNNAVDADRGREIAETLRKLYHFIGRHLGEVLTDNNIAKAQEALKILSDLRETWQELSDKVSKDNVSGPGDVYHGTDSGTYG
ncbi:MAG: flagellar export chaperone FliS [Deltaproteobacteria bacterium]|nr:flagellar export chaperone FliS [Deltaproteobacteria bacterium]